MVERLQERAYALLRKTEKYTKTDMVYLTGGSFWLFLKTGLSAVLAFAVLIAFANLLPQETYGAYKYVFSLFGLLALPTLMGLGTSVIKSVAQGYEGTPAAVLKTKILWGFMGSAASAGVALYYGLQGNMQLAAAFGVVAVFVPFIDTFSIFNTILTGKQLFKVSVFYETVTQAVSSVAVVTALFLTDELWIILASYFLSMTAVRAIAFWHIVKTYTTNKNVDDTALSYGKHLSVLEVLVTAVDTLDGILLWQFVGAAPLAVYSFAKTIPLQVSGALRRIPTLAFPKFANRDLASIQKGIMPKLMLLFAILIPITIAYIVCAPFLFSLLFPQYVEAVPYTQFFALSLLLFPKKLFGTALGAHRCIREQYISAGVALSAKVIFMLLLIPSFGIMGAITAELLTQAVSFVTIVVLFFRAKPPVANGAR